MSAPPPPRSSAASSSAPGSAAVPPPPRSSVASPAPQRSESPAAPSPAGSSRPGTPSGGRPAKSPPTLSVPSLLHDLVHLKGADALADFQGATSGHPASGLTLADVRAGTFDPATAPLDRDTAVHLADAFVGEMDALLESASAAVSSTATTRRAEAVGDWAGRVEKGLEARA